MYVPFCEMLSVHFEVGFPSPAEGWHNIKEKALPVTNVTANVFGRNAFIIDMHRDAVFIYSALTNKV